MYLIVLQFLKVSLIVYSNRIVDKKCKCCSLFCFLEISEMDRGGRGFGH